MKDGRDEKGGGRKKRVRFPLVIKLIGIISIIVVVSMALVTGIASWFFSEDSRARAEENTLTVSQVLAAQITGRIESTHSGTLSLLDTLRENAGNRSLERAAVSNWFDRNASVALVSVPGQKEIRNDKFFKANELDSAALQPFLESAKGLIERAKEGESLVANASPSVGIPAAALFVPYRDMGTRNALVIVFSTEEFLQMVQTDSAGINYVVGWDGGLIVHPDFDLVKMGANFSDRELVKKALESPSDNLQIRYRDVDGTRYLGAFRRLSVGALAVTSSTPTALVYRAATDVLRRNFLLSGVVLLISVLAVWFFSKSISRPVLSLVRAAHRIEEGDFELDILPETRDELGLLTESFVEMGKGLAERERVKETFGKFVNKEIAEQALKGELKLGGQRKTATIFFSDIRSFTAISERLSPEAVVEFLNEYMTRMVACIEKTGGVVDKFIGDAIMGVWGAPVSAGTPRDDALAAVRAMLMMRDELLEFNKGRGTPEKPFIHNGAGVNTGPVIAGQIGSLSRMEYTVIGDAVNLASRIEALNKPFGTDVLISEYTWDLVKDAVIAEPMPAITVKGKTAPLTIYAVVKMKGDEGPGSLSELREKLGIADPGKKIEVDKEEVKYEIVG
ncbi:adenylate/guanylate cyclase domain-containing protein [Treponema zuelzerae]|uniref:Adenylate/guanylate cyclase domain-containing protein n=1 Tax=Teretinema zuelzerae TaxID=156 RepID=A0AAE3EGI7_9SPIR|nr:adenylate/guanylate cyclase domain-containing protein [Teretinema zuelzerae]MCD1653403.1 adenylate/guanylate cyclase domain-containing protein [Teretinema zuelzerae]